MLKFNSPLLVFHPFYPDKGKSIYPKKATKRMAIS